MLKIQSDRVIIDGHEPTKEQCETMTLLANALVESNNFKTVEYRDGYAEFEKVGKAECLKFAGEGTVIEVNSTTLDTTLHTAGKYCNKNILVKSSDSNLIAENIKKDVSVFGVTGSYAGVDVSDTTATQGDVLSGKYFYGADGMKTEGTIPVHTETSIILNAGTGDQYVPAGHYSDILTKLVLNPDAASKIKQGEVILGVTGSYAGSGSAIEVATEAEMANILSSATADDNGKIYRYIGTTGTYVNGALYWLEVPVEPIEPTTDELAGTWVFNDTVDISTAFNYSLNFVAKYNDNDTNFVSISATTSGFAKGIAYTAEDANIGTIIVYRASGWDYEAYKTIAITSKLSEVSNGDTLLAWLQANATKQ